MNVVFVLEFLPFLFGFHGRVTESFTWPVFKHDLVGGTTTDLALSLQNAFRGILLNQG